MSHSDHSISLDDLAKQLGIEIHQTSTETNHHSIPQIDTNHTNQNHQLPTPEHHQLDNFLSLNNHPTWLHSDQPDQPVNPFDDNLKNSLGIESHGLNQNAVNQNPLWLESEPQTSNNHNYNTFGNQNESNQTNFNQHHQNDQTSANHHNQSVTNLDSYPSNNFLESLASRDHQNSENTNNHHGNQTNDHYVVMNSSSGNSTLSTTVHLYDNGDVYWDKGGYAGHISGNTFYNSQGDIIATLGADWKIYDVNHKIIGYIDEHGACHNMAGTIIADEGTVTFCGSQLVYNVARSK